MKIIKVIIAVIWFPFLFLAIRYIPFDHLPSTCVFLHLTGYPCFTCGLTRAMMAIAAGNWERAWIMNPLAYPLFAVMIILWVLMIRETAADSHKLRSWLYRNAGIIAIYSFVILFVFGICRIAGLYFFYNR